MQYTNRGFRSRWASFFWNTLWIKRFGKDSGQWSAASLRDRDKSRHSPSVETQAGTGGIPENLKLQAISLTLCWPCPWEPPFKDIQQTRYQHLDSIFPFKMSLHIKILNHIKKIMPIKPTNVKTREFTPMNLKITLNCFSLKRTQWVTSILKRTTLLTINQERVGMKGPIRNHGNTIWKIFEKNCFKA